MYACTASLWSRAARATPSETAPSSPKALMKAQPRKPGAVNQVCSQSKTAAGASSGVAACSFT